MQMLYILLAFATGMLFFLVIPAFGAFRVRHKWRLFRRRIIQAGFFPLLSYGSARSKHNGFLGNFRFFGNIQAIQDDNVLWVSNKKLSVTVDLNNVTVYQLPVINFSDSEGIFPDEPVQVMESRKIGTLPQGSQVMICGPLFVLRGTSVYRSDGRTPVTILLYDGPEKSIMQRTIWSGRQKNEYWNPLTPGSLITGVIALLAIGYFLYRNPSLYIPSVFTFTLALLPAVPFLPPGIILFYLYNVFWKQGRVFRAERDLFLLPLRFFPHNSSTTPNKSVLLPTKEKYLCRKFNSLEEAEQNIPEGRFHQVPLLQKIPAAGYYAYGAEKKDSRKKLYEPADPMAESVIIPGNPLALSAMCVARARIKEIFSALAFGFAVIINFILLYTAVYFLIR